MKKIALLLLVIVCMSVTMLSCTPNVSPIIEASENLRESNLYGVEKETDQGAFLDGVQTFSANLCQRIYQSDGSLFAQNTAISPLSVYMALALAVECSQGRTREQILQVLGLSYGQVRTFTGDLYSASVRQRGKTIGTMLNETPTNSVWLQTGQKYDEDCLKILAEEYFCSTFSVDFAGNNDEANRSIRAFVKEKTNDLIDGDFGLEPTTLFALINTLYLKSLWNSDGDDLRKTSEKRDFLCFDGTKMQKRMLVGQYCHGRTRQEEDYLAMFTESVGCKLYFIVPTEGKSLSDVLTADNIRDVVCADYKGDDYEEKIHYYTRCVFPEFEADYSGKLDRVISDWGASDLFDENCDFGAILPESKAACNGIIHKTKLTVDEKGIEGAAVTVMSGATSAGPDGWEKRYEEFFVDCAFGYVLCDDLNNILFVGSIAKIR